ncbi:hypothetical protein EV188_106239 [Actinomycetospora succinea]|uniref:Uncharacterized protein n=1 Tax=Actinomycetospora succinea TaxID=663603 RepID=A0A4R6V2E1_9PSEU|nr:hypothetical protein [Actinomycetospora succinea]TDQ54092.1 hypothetical protein EV188_106239 [Actinomycetospora succinea]
MPQNFKIDQAATFESLLFLSCEPKTAFGDNYRQETTKDGLPKWQFQLAARFRQFGRATNEIINVGMVAEQDPGQDLMPATPVQLVGFEIGVMDKRNRDGEPVGAQVWYRCEEVRPLTATGPARSGKQPANAGSSASTSEAATSGAPS